MRVILICLLLSPLAYAEERVCVFPDICTSTKEEIRKVYDDYFRMQTKPRATVERTDPDEQETLPYEEEQHTHAAPSEELMEQIG